ncbi:putative C-S lyase [Martelella lutilitoris]|uniref:cysteine-S-conjugate beta-lyase n=1 Tax=Martelella lutilitoris TaxID=2583532 RepID=A0A5C4JUS9_9HYPH|nr:PatB family C-S lyase [Martelella lutilitoris]TNB49057.1 putative C-S lyase [Martelella lutilitoris]
MTQIVSVDRRGSDANKWRAFGPDVIPLPVADMDFAVAPEIIAAIERRLAHPVLGYGAATDSLRETLVAALAAEYGWHVAPEWLVFLPGVEPGFNMALNAFTAPGDTVMQEYPVYKPLRTAPDTWGLTTAAVWQSPSGDGRWVSNEKALEEAAARSRLMLLCNPQNPTGRVYTRDELALRAELCIRHDMVLVSDEIHCGLTLDGRAHVPVASLSKAIEARTITLMAASKTWNIAGLKAAFAVIADEKLRAAFMGAKKGLVDSVNILGLAAMEAAYRDGAEWRDGVRATIAENRDMLQSFVAATLPKAKVLPAEASFLAWVDLSAYALDAPAADWLLTHARVGLSGGSDFGPGLENWVRLNFACAKETLAEALARMAKALEQR